jgi:cardiolipin synthase (CMP-forming)
MNLPSVITLVRLLLLPFFLVLLIKYSPGEEYLRYTALLIFILASLTDFLDGFLARRLKETTDIGRVLDAAADKIFLISSFLVLSLFSDFPRAAQLPLWVVFVVIGRDIIIVSGTIFIYLKFKQLYVFPTKLGKISIVFEMATIISILLFFGYSFIIWYTTAVLVIISGIGYLIKSIETFKGGVPGQ